MESTSRKCFVELPTSVTLEYDHQTDTLHIVLGNTEEQLDEEILSNDNSVIFGLKNNKLITIIILNFSKKLEESSI